MRFLLYFLFTLISIYSFGQTINLKNTKSDADVLVVNNAYKLFFPKNDLVSAISLIDKTLKTDNREMIQKINGGTIKIINLQTEAVEIPFIELLKNNLGSYLLLKGMVAIEKEGRMLDVVVVEESPEMESLDGTIKTTLFFSEKENDSPVFLGDLNSRVKQLK